MKKHSCSGRVWERMGSFSCSNSGTREINGKWWCFHHDPREVEKKQKALKEKWERERKENDKKTDTAGKLLKRLGVSGSIEYLETGGYQSAIVIDFDEAEKLLKELGR